MNSATAEIMSAMDARHKSEAATKEILQKRYNTDLLFVEKQINDAISRGEKRVSIPNSKLRAYDELKTYLESKGYNVYTDAKNFSIRWD